MIDHKKVFYKQLKTSFFPGLREIGFKGSGQHFRKIDGELIQTISIQHIQHGGSCCVYLGIHFTFLPVTWDVNKYPDLRKIQVADCEFRTRMTPLSEKDYWWSFKGPGPYASTSKSVDHLCTTFHNEGMSFFNKFDNPGSVLQEFPLSVLQNHTGLAASEIEITCVRAALTMARIQKHLGNIEQQQAYAKFALNNLAKAVALEQELLQLSRGT